MYNRNKCFHFQMSHHNKCSLKTCHHKKFPPKTRHHKLTFNQQLFSPPQVLALTQHKTPRDFPNEVYPHLMETPLQWQTFWDSFNAAVHSNSNLSGVEKFNYLKAQTSGEAARGFNGFPLTNTNYEQAI